MDFNGDLIVEGDGSGPVLSNFAASTDATDNANGTKGTLTFASGFKIQWDTVSLTSDEDADFALPEAYTGAHLYAFASYGSNISNTANESSINIRPGSTTPLTSVRIKQNAEATESVSYMSFGFDL